VIAALILLFLAVGASIGSIQFRSRQAEDDDRAMSTNFDSSKDSLNPFQALMADQPGDGGEFRKRLWEYPSLFFILSLCYSWYLKDSLNQAGCSSGGIEIDFDFALLLAIVKFVLLTGWPCALVAMLDSTWRSKDAWPVVLSTYLATCAFWIHKYGGGYCPKCVIFGLVGYLFSASIGHEIGASFGAARRAGKTLISLAVLTACIIVASLTHPAARTAPLARVTAIKVQPVVPTQPPPAKAPVTDAAPQADYSLTAEKAAGTPHFWQLDPRGGFKNGGQAYCGPVAISDSLVYLARHGFPELLPAGEGDEAQIALINSLASPHYLGTDEDHGTGSGSVLKGIEKYVVAHGYQCTTMEYEGLAHLGRHEEEFIVADKPDLDWMKKGVLDPHGAVWLDVGWYTQTGDGQWKRSGGHWVPMVGFDAADPYALLIHNPGTRGNAGQPDDPARDVVHLQVVDTGTLDLGNGPTVSAAGRYVVAGPGLPKSHDTVAFLEAAIVVVVSKL